MNNLRPGAIALLGGGALLVLSTLLEWGGDESGISLDARGLQGLICLAIGIAVVAVVAMANFGGKTISLNIGGLDTNEIFMTLGISAFLITFGLQFADGSAFGLFLGWVGSAAIVVGSFLESKDTATAMPPSAM